ncbi:glucose-1-phosphate cytidylyltransferase [Pedobacter steynii]|uniref:Glucose-1-phosphate cytidylyltransferase n=1 Tax=Pedobacter steynii TaxID=430522 RepID=A0A1G9WHE0_9SPHI|nr:glucose-1-phosphate cytidylyltransferase [Pedobacter steynii]NQX40300.1 glucose-1-phosphate cytidylyltransferase [Pedobacter steynii]SDM83982.1 glucose-1-phosphate cytidylyltransferase [Pedobacter steynii]
MEVVILCGGKGTRLSEETLTRPKPMVEIGGMPILWHIMKTYSSFGYKKFVLALGYKASFIKEYFYNLRISGSDFTLKMTPDHEPVFYNSMPESDWEITFVDTGEETLKGARVKRLEKYIKSENFLLTYGDGVSDVDIDKLVDFHLASGKIATVTAVHPPSRFGELELDGTSVTNFEEKPQMATGYINGGYFVFNKSIMNYLTEDEDCDLEFGALQKISQEGELQAFMHNDFWQCMDNVRERDYLDNLVKNNKAPWIKKNSNNV